MKKLFVIILTLCLACTLVSGQEIGSDSLEQTAVTSVYSHMPSMYSILIPSTVNANNQTYEIRASVLDLCQGDKVYVTIRGVANNELTLSTPEGKIMTAGFQNNYDGGVVNDGSVIAMFDDNNKTLGGSFSIYPKSWQGPGNYFGSLTFDISLQEELVIW